MGTGTLSFHTLSWGGTLLLPPCAPQSGGCPNPVLLHFYGGFMTQVWSAKSLPAGNLSQSSAPLPAPEVGNRGGAAISNLVISGWSPGNQAPSSGALQKSVSSQATKRDKRESNSFPRREMINNHWVSQSQIHDSKNEFLQTFFSCYFEFGK